VLIGQVTPGNREPNEEKFLTYLKLAKDCASEVANYQSPKFKAVAISIESAPGGAGAAGGGAAPNDGSGGGTGMRVVSAQDAYKLLRDGDLIVIRLHLASWPAPAKKRGAA